MNFYARLGCSVSVNNMKLELKKGISKGRALKLLSKDISRELLAREKVFIQKSEKNSATMVDGAWKDNLWFFRYKENQKLWAEARELIKAEYGLNFTPYDHYIKCVNRIANSTDLFKYGKLAKKHGGYLDLENILFALGYFYNCSKKV